jgi:hypothetical protein
MYVHVEQLIRGGQLRFRVVQGIAPERAYYSRKHGWTSDACNATLFVSVAKAERSLSATAPDADVSLEPAVSPWCD